MKRVSPRITEATETWLSETFSSLSGGAEYVLEAAESVYRRFVVDMKKAFSQPELKLIIDAYNGHMLTARFAGQGLSLGIQDSIKYDGLDSKWEIDGDALVGKIQALSLPEKMLMEAWAKGYWEQHPAQTLEQYIA